MSSNTNLWAHGALTAVAIVACGYLYGKVNSLEEQISALSVDSPAEMTQTHRPTTHSPSSTLAVGQAAPEHKAHLNTPNRGHHQRGAASVPEADIEEKLWSDEGRAAIDDVVNEREEQRRERRSDRWQKMQDFRTQRTIDKAVEEFDLSKEDEAQLQILLTTHMEARSERWQKMHDDDEEADPQAIMEEAEAERENFRIQVTSLLGEDGPDRLGELMHGPRY